MGELGRTRGPFFFGIVLFCISGLPPPPVTCNIESREEETEKSPPRRRRSPLERGPTELHPPRAPPPDHRRLRKRSPAEREARQRFQRPQELGFIEAAARPPDIVTPRKGEPWGFSAGFFSAASSGSSQSSSCPAKTPVVSSSRFSLVSSARSWAASSVACWVSTGRVSRRDSSARRS